MSVGSFSVRFLQFIQDLEYYLQDQMLSFYLLAKLKDSLLVLEKKKKKTWHYWQDKPGISPLILKGKPFLFQETRTTFISFVNKKTQKDI